MTERFAVAIVLGVEVVDKEFVGIGVVVDDSLIAEGGVEILSINLQVLAPQGNVNADRSSEIPCRLAVSDRIADLSSHGEQVGVLCPEHIRETVALACRQARLNVVIKLIFQVHAGSKYHGFLRHAMRGKVATETKHGNETVVEIKSILTIDAKCSRIAGSGEVTPLPVALCAEVVGREQLVDIIPVAFITCAE